ncbi:unnamed protein product, partial [Prorocentrum cordatum]
EAIFFLFSERRNYQRQLARQKWHAQPTEPPVASGRCRDKLSKSSGSTRREGKAEEAHFFSERRNDQRQLAPHKWHAQPTWVHTAGRARQKRRTSSLNAEIRRSPAADAGTSCLNQWVHTAGRARQKKRTSSLNAEMTSGTGTTEVARPADRAAGRQRPMRGQAV